MFFAFKDGASGLATAHTFCASREVSPNKLKGIFVRFILARAVETYIKRKWRVTSHFFF